MSEFARAALILANLLVAVQAVRSGWGYYETLLVYWCEAVIVGAYNVLRLLVVGFFGDQPLGATVARWVDVGPWYNRVFLTLLGAGFFAFKFATFALTAGFLVLALPAAFTETGISHGIEIWQGLRAVGRGVFIAIVLLALSHGISFVRNFLFRREYIHMNVLALIVWPYARMFLVIAVLSGGLVMVALVPGLWNATAFSVAIILLKLGVDAASHHVEHRWIATLSATPSTR